MSRSTDTVPLPFEQALSALKTHLPRVMGLGFLCSFLALSPSLYMFQVYDRAINTRDPLTLSMLTLAVLAIYVLLEMLDYLRQSLLLKSALSFDLQHSESIFNAIFAAGLKQGKVQLQLLRDFRLFCDFLSAKTMLSLLDAPFSLLYLALIFWLHPFLGVVTLAALCGQILLTYLAEVKTQSPLSEASRAGMAAQTYVGNTLGNAQVIEAMGMIGPIHQRWRQYQETMIEKQAEASDQASLASALSKLLQQTLSSGLLALAAVFALEGTLTGGAGMMVVASILGTKTLGPLVQLVTQWKHLLGVRESYQRLIKVLKDNPPNASRMSLPRPQGHLTVENLVGTAPGQQQTILRGLSFSLAPGEMLALIGPSASGKSSLARLLVGVWPALSGKVRLDGADLDQWNKEELGPAIGYLPQDVELFEGTLAENIARFGEMDETKLQEAITLTGLTALVDQLPEGLATPIGEGGCFLSGGQRQRVGLARAVYGSPSLIVLDEPNASLDEAGEQALMHALKTLKARGATLIMITHRTNILSVTDKILILKEGRMHAFGPRDEVLAAQWGKPSAPPTPALAPQPAK